MLRSTESMMQYSSDDQVSTFNYPLTTTSSTVWDENQPWPNTDGIWTTSITAQVIMPVDDIEEYTESSFSNKRSRTNTTNSINKFMKYNNDHTTLDSNGDISEVHEPEKIYHEMATVPIQASSFSPELAVRSIVTNCLQEMQPPPPPVVSKRVRPERQYGEEITTGGLLQELKNKKVAKEAQLKRPRRTQKKLKGATVLPDSNSST
ncbi:unnamed protein product, partial [Rotaria magnacalcarata]